MAKKKAVPPVDADALADEVGTMEALIKRKKKAQRDLAALEDGDDTEDDEIAPLPGSELVDQVMASLGGDGSFSVTKLDGTETVDCGSYDLPLWPDAMQGVIKKNGGGNYVLVFHRSDGTIAKRIKRTYPGAPAAQAPAPSQGMDMIAMLKIMEDRASRQEAANESLRLEAMKSQQSMMTAMIQMVGAQNKPMVNNAAELATIAKLFGAGEKRDSLSDLVALKDLLDDFRGDPEDSGVKIQTDSPIVALLAPILQALGKGMNAAPQPAPRSPRPAIETVKPPTPQAVAPEPPKTSPTPTADPSPASEASGLLEYAVMLKTAIDNGATPQFAADKSWEDARSRAQEPILINLIETGDWEGLKKHPDLSAHAAWIDSFRDCLRAGMVVEAEPEEAQA